MGSLRDIAAFQLPVTACAPAWHQPCISQLSLSSLYKNAADCRLPCALQHALCHFPAWPRASTRLTHLTLAWLSPCTCKAVRACPGPDTAVRVAQGARRAAALDGEEGGRVPPAAAAAAVLAGAPEPGAQVFKPKPKLSSPVQAESQPGVVRQEKKVAFEFRARMLSAKASCSTLNWS